MATSLPLAALACSPAAPPAATPRPPPAPPPAAPAASAPAAPQPPRLSGFTDLFASVPDAPLGERPQGRQGVRRTSFGRGTFTHRIYHVFGRPGQPCPVARDEGCGSFSLRTGAPAPTAPLWVSATAEAPAGAQTERGPFAAPHEWVAFAGGRDAVYALRTGGKHIDRIDDQGKVTPFVSDDAMTDWDELMIVELPGRQLVIGMGPPQRGQRAGDEGPTGPGWQLAEVIDGPGGAHRLGPVTELPMKPINPYRTNAQGARGAAEDGKMASIGVPQMMLLPDDGADKNRWAMVWLEVVAPPYSWPHNRPQKGVTLAATAPPKKKASARHGCGGPSSRGLDDKSVTKRAHVTRFAGARLLDDTVAWTGADVGDPLTLRLDARLDGDQVTVALPSRTRPKNAPSVMPPWPGDDDEELRLTRDEDITVARFDPASGEGIVVARDGERSLFRLFDAGGQPVGEPAVVSQPGAIQDVARVGGKWMALTSSPPALLNLTDRTGPFELPKGRRGATHLVATEQGGALLSLEGRNLQALPLGPSGVTGPAETVAELSKTFDPRFFTFALKGSTKVGFLEPREDKDGVDRLAWRGLTPGADWQRVELPGREAIHWYMVGMRSLHDDVVVAAQRPDRQVYTWVRSGRSVDKENVGKKPPPEVTSPIRTGPLLGGGLRLPSEPGPPVADEIAIDANQCPRSIATGPNTVVLACVRASDPQVPGLRVALRTLTLGAPR